MKNINKKANNKNGFLIACEGISGSGKTENFRLIYYFLSMKNYKTAIVEWNSSYIIRKIISFFNSLKLLSPTLYSILQWVSFIKDYLFKIMPLLRNNYVVLADRYIYTGLIRDAANGAKLQVGNFLYKIFRKPDLLIYHNTNINLCYERILNRGKQLFYPGRSNSSYNNLRREDLSYLKKLCSLYKKLLDDPLIKNTSDIIVLSNDDKDIKICNVVELYVIRKYGYFITINMGKRSPDVIFNEWDDIKNIN